jgi:hypothetical protein
VAPYSRRSLAQSRTKLLPDAWTRQRLGVAVEVLRSKQTPFRGATACVLPIGELARALAL